MAQIKYTIYDMVNHTQSSNTEDIYPLSKDYAYSRIDTYARNLLGENQKYMLMEFLIDGEEQLTESYNEGGKLLAETRNTKTEI